MELNKKFVFLMFFFIVGFNCVGCSSLNDYILENQREGLEITTAKHDAILADIEQHIGKNKKELRAILGEPSEIISPSSWKNVEYDEEWVYEKGIPFVNKQYRMFYIKDDVVIHVEFGGIF